MLVVAGLVTFASEHTATKVAMGLGPDRGKSLEPVDIAGDRGRADDDADDHDESSPNEVSFRFDLNE